MPAGKSVGQLLLNLVLGLLMIASSAVLFRLCLSALTRYAELPDAWTTVLRPIGTIASVVLGYWLFAASYERRAVTELALPRRSTLLAGLLGGLLILVTIVPLFAIGFYTVERYRSFAGVPRVAGYIFIAALLEEVVFRGLIFRLLEQHTGTTLGLLLQSALFGALHLFNADGTALTIVSVTLLGAFWTLVFIHSRNLWVVACNHAVWNTTIFLSGIPLSGMQEWRISAPLETRYEGPIWLTGGGFGPEDSIINVLTMVLVCAAMKKLVARNPIAHGSFVDAPEWVKRAAQRA